MNFYKIIIHLAIDRIAEFQMAQNNNMGKAIAAGRNMLETTMIDKVIFKSLPKAVKYAKDYCSVSVSYNTFGKIN